MNKIEESLPDIDVSSVTPYGSVNLKDSRIIKSSLLVHDFKDWLPSFRSMTVGIVWQSGNKGQEQ